MRAATAKPAISFSGIGLLALGGGLVLLALILLARAPGDGGSNNPATAGALSVADPLAATSENVAFWEQRVAADPADFTALNRLAMAYIQRGRETGDVSNYSSAQAAVDASLASLPGDNYTAYALKAYLQNVQHDFTASLETAQHAATLDPGDPFAQLVVGDNLLALGRYDEAFETFNTLANESPSLSTFSRLAQAYEIRGDLRNADGAWKNAIELDGGQNAETSAWVRTQYATFLFNQGRINDAGVHFNSALEAFPGYIHALAGQGNVAAANGDYDEAIELYMQVTRRQPLPQYVAQLGDVYAAAGMQTDADRQYELIGAIEQLYQANGINVDLQMSLFFSDHDIRPDEAVRQAEGALTAQPDSTYAADALAWALHKAGRSAEALPYAQTALAQGTQDAHLYYHMGMIQKALGKEAAARDALRQALAINPHFSPPQAPIAQQALEELGG
jgi:tetratricopeptide (TPR) repeat protein